MRTKTYAQQTFDQAMGKASRFEANLRSILDPMIITDEDGVIFYVNDILTQITGFDRYEIIGKTPGELWGNQKDKSYYDYMWHTIKVEKKPFIGNFLNRRKDGTYYSCDFKIYPILDDKKDILFFVGISSNFADAI